MIIINTLLYSAQCPEASRRFTIRIQIMIMIIYVRVYNYKCRRTTMQMQLQIIRTYEFFKRSTLLLHLKSYSIKHSPPPDFPPSK